MDTWVTVQHMHTVPAWGGKAGYCNKQARVFCQCHGISWGDLIKNGGLWASQLEATNDAMALRLVAWAKANPASNNGE